MKNIMDNLYNNIINATRNIEEINLAFSSIEGNTLCVGSGGSKVVATFLAKVLTNKNKAICNAYDPSSISSLINNYNNIVICSYSGKNYGVKYCLNNKLNKYLFSSREKSIDDETLIHYDLKDEKSFISLGATLIPMAIILKYYLGENFDYYLEDMFKRIDKNLNLDVSKHLNIFINNTSITAMTFLESSLIESGMIIPIINYKYDYCHGRSTINKGHTSSAIIFSEDRDIDKELSEVCTNTMGNSIVISTPYTDEVISDFYYTLQSLYLLYNMAESKKINLRDIDYDRVAVKRLYHFKGSM